MNILHRAEGFLLAELPSLEDGVKHLISQAGSSVVLHRFALAGGALLSSTEMNVPILRAIVDALNVAAQ